MKYEEWFKYQLMNRDETTPEMKLAKAWSTCAWYHQEKHHQKKDLNKIIQEIKQKTQSLKDKRKNIRYKFNINLITTPIDKAIAGASTLPNPCKAPLIICSITFFKL